MTSNKKAAASALIRATSLLHNTLDFFSTFTWRLGYSLEEARQSHEANQRHTRRMACCIGLAALRLLTGGLHHV